MPYRYSESEVARAKAQVRGAEPEDRKGIGWTCPTCGTFSKTVRLDGQLPCGHNVGSEGTPRTARKPTLRSRYVDKIPIIALMLATQPRRFFNDLAQHYRWTPEEVQAARQYLAALGAKPYGET